MKVRAEDFQSAAKALKRIDIGKTPAHMLVVLERLALTEPVSLPTESIVKIANHVARHLRPSRGAAQVFAASRQVPHDRAQRLELVFQLLNLLEVEGIHIAEDHVGHVESAVDAITRSIAFELLSD